MPLHSTRTPVGTTGSVLAVLLSTTLASLGLSQSPPKCASILTRSEARKITIGQSDSVLRQWSEFNTVTWEWIRGWFLSHEEPSLGFPPHDVPGLADQIRNRIKGHPRDEWIASIALSEMMRGQNGGVLLGRQGSLCFTLRRRERSVRLAVPGSLLVRDGLVTVFVGRLHADAGLAARPQSERFLTFQTPSEPGSLRVLVHLHLRANCGQ